MNLKEKVSYFLSCIKDPRICSFDLETLVVDSGGFLKGERIISVSICERVQSEIKCQVFIAESDSYSEEMRILRDLDQRMAEISPDIILGYNHTGYDIPLIMTKIKTLRWEDRLRNLEFYFGTSWCLDMMYLVSEDVFNRTGSYKTRKLSETLTLDLYRDLPTMKVKGISEIENMNKGEAIKFLWNERRDDFFKYSLGDSYDLLVLFDNIMSQ
ncbi:MAG: hypothetical protein M1402_00570 [Candidatus Thermoplasmatota archaeon]|nr:hypothetical protein [Candidatus Thermoplasmatota archaeon]